MRTASVPTSAPIGTPAGDRTQMLVFIGQDMDEQAIRAKLDACLLDDATANEDSAAWAALVNPSPSWRWGMKSPHESRLADHRGGIHGVHIAAKLLGEAEVAPAQLRIVDPGDRLLERWRTCTATTGMTHLRSPSVHNLDLNPWSLLRYAGKRKTRKPGLFAPPYDRPHLGFFNDHCDKVIEDFDLSSKHVRARATHCTVDCDHVTVKLSTGEALMTRNVVLAIGAGEQPEWPAWALRDDPRIHHI